MPIIRAGIQIKNKQKELGVIMKRYLFIVMLIIPFISIYGTQITKTFVFNKSDLSFRQEQGYDIVLLKGCLTTTKFGEPQLPVKVIHFLIPADNKVSNITISSTQTEFAGEYNIIPAQIPRTIGADWHWTEPNQEIYNSSNLYPERVAELSGEGYLAGNKVASVVILPLQYIPHQRKLIFRNQITVTLNLIQDNNTGIVPIRRTRESEELIERMIKGLVNNSEDFEQCAMRSAVVDFSTIQKFEPTQVPSPTGSLVSYVIITSDDLANNFQALADWKTKKGVPAVVRTVSWINANYDGSDVQERIRNFIKDAYTNWGTTWVLLGGDVNVVPARYVECSVSWCPNYPDGLITSDLYYAHLDGNWNANGNSIFGEDEGEYGGDLVDYYPEVFIGRAPAENITEANTFVTKIFNYEKNPPVDYTTSLLCIGENLFYPGDSRQFCDTIADHHIPAYFQKTKLYECENTLTHESAIKELNRGYGLIYSQNHGGIDLIKIGSNEPRLTSQDLDGLQNGLRQSIWFAVSCNTNCFRYDCFSEHFLNNPNGGGVAYIASVWWDYPWANFDFDKAFFDSLFGGCYNIGAALAKSKLPFIGGYDNVWRLCILGRLLLGDPEMPVWSDEPRTYGVIHPNHIGLGQSEFSVYVWDEGLGEPVSEALVCLKKGNEQYGYGFTDEEGRITFLVRPESEGEMSVVITKHDYLPYDGICMVDNQGAYVCYYSHLIDDRASGNGNMIPEASEFIEMPLTLKNTGTEKAKEVYAVLSCTSQYITIFDDTRSFGDIPAGEIRSSEAPYTFEIDRNCPDVERVWFNLRIYAANGEYIDEFLVNVFAPSLTHFSHIIDDDQEPPSSGDGDGIPEPGETIELPMALYNNGLGQADQVTAILTTDDPYVNIIQDMEEFEDILPRSEKINISNNFLFELSTEWECKEPFFVTIRDRYERTKVDTFWLKIPKMPLSLCALPGRNYIDLTWTFDSCSNVFGYNVYQSEQSGGPYTKRNILPITNGSYFKDEGLERARGYYYVVTAIDSSRNESFFSEELLEQTNPLDLNGWPKTIDAEAQASPLACDLDPEYPGLEVITVDLNGNIYAWHSDGTGVVEENGKFAYGGYTCYASPAVGDINLDGRLEMITVHTDFSLEEIHIYCWDCQGNVLWSEKIPEWGVATPVICELDDDLYPEILIAVRGVDATNGGKIYRFEHDGKCKLFAKVDDDIFNVSSPAVGDIDRDGKNEVFIGGAKSVYAWRASGERYKPYYAWPDTNSPWPRNFTSPVIGDIVPEREGLELAVVAPYDNAVYLGDKDGNLFPWWPKYLYWGYGWTLDNLWITPALGDLDHDGRLEIIFSGEWDVLAYTVDGLANGFPAFRRRNSTSAPVIGDIQGNENLEILIGSAYQDDQLYCFNYDGSKTIGFPILAEYPISNSPVIADIDQDGDVEVIVAGTDRKVYVFCLEGEYNPERISWGTFRHDNWRTGCYETRLDTKSSTQESFNNNFAHFILYQPKPNPFTNQTGIRFQIPIKAKVDLKIYNSVGRLVNTLINDEMNPGYYTMSWNGRDEIGRTQSNGIYFIRLKTEDYDATKKMIMVR